MFHKKLLSRDFSAFSTTRHLERKTVIRPGPGLPPPGTLARNRRDELGHGVEVRIPEGSDHFSPRAGMVC